MSRKITGAALAVLTATTAIAAVTFGTSASAAFTTSAKTAKAAPRCTTGWWWLAKTTGQINGPDSTLKLAGGQGTLIQVTAKGTVRFAFARSLKLWQGGTAKKVPFTMWQQYDKNLTFNFKITGNTKGWLALDRKSARGDATMHGKVERPAAYPLEKQPLAPLIKSGKADEALVPLVTTYTCTSKTLTLTRYTKANGYTTWASWQYRR